MSHRVLIVSPVRNEAAHIERVVRAVGAQTRPPDVWVVVDDGSDDGTLEILRSLEGELPFLRVVASDRSTNGTADQLAMGAPAHAFNLGLGQVDHREFTHVGKLDGDIELPPDYYERVLAKFDADPALGIAGGTLVEPRGDDWKPLRIPPHHVHGALKLYTGACFAAVGGVQGRLGWDVMDETYARMRGFATRSYRELQALHHRPVASAGGPLRGQARHGRTAYLMHYTLLWVTLRSVKVGVRNPPPALSGAAFLGGYLWAAVRRTPRVDDKELRRFVRRELRGRLLRPLGLRRRLPR